MRETQKDQIRNHLYEKGEITSWDAIMIYGITRIGEYIRSLRHEDLLDIKSVWEERKGKRYVRYVLKPPELKLFHNENYYEEYGVQNDQN